MKKPLLLGIILTVCIVIVAFVFVQAYPLGIVSIWKFDETSGTIASDDADANNGDLINSPVWTTGKVGGALSFDGINDYVDVGNGANLDITGAITMSGWVYFNSHAHYSTIMLKGNATGTLGLTSYGLFVTDAGKPYVILYGAYPADMHESDTVLDTERWYHLAATWDGTINVQDNVKIYVNGVLDNSFKQTHPLNSTVESVTIGSMKPPYYYNRLDGILDEVAIYNRALSAEEIATLAGLCVAPPDNLVSWWPGDGNAIDIVGNNDGTVQNGTIFATGKVGQAFLFSAPGDMINVEHDPSLNLESLLNATFEGWFKSNIDNDAVIVAKHECGIGYGWFFTTKQGGYIGNDYVGGYGVEALDLNDGEFHHFAIVKSGTNYYEYIDGVLISSNAGFQYGTPAGDDIPLQIGSINTGICYPVAHQLNGIVDELSLYDRALSQSEIQGIYNAGSAGKCKELVNQPPVALCQDIEISVDDNCQATIAAADVDGGSDDPDEGDTFTLSIDPTVLPLGETLVTLTVTDEHGESDTCVATVTVVDETPPIPDVFELQDVTGECFVTITSTPTATDNCAGTILGTTSDSLEYTVRGTYTVNWTYDDGNNNFTTQTQTVVVDDTTPPEISVSVSPDILRPPNHKMVPITISIIASDNCNSDPEELDVALTSITMNEGDETDAYDPLYDSTLGAGHTADDIQVSVDGKIYLRAERSGKGDGRIYTITYTVTDASGNSTEASAIVEVPHNK